MANLERFLASSQDALLANTDADMFWRFDAPTCSFAEHGFGVVFDHSGELVGDKVYTDTGIAYAQLRKTPVTEMDFWIPGTEKFRTTAIIKNPYRYEQQYFDGVKIGVQNGLIFYKNWLFLGSVSADSLQVHRPVLPEDQNNLLRKRASWLRRVNRVLT